MNRRELFELHRDLSEDALEVMKNKNEDYSSNNDPFANFKGSQSLNIDPVKGALIRCSDKLSRISSFIDNGTLKVKDESVKDTIIDLINYSVLIYGMIQEEEEEEEEKKSLNVLEKEANHLYDKQFYKQIDDLLKKINSFANFPKLNKKYFIDPLAKK